MTRPQRGLLALLDDRTLELGARTVTRKYASPSERDQDQRWRDACQGELDRRGAR